VQQGEALLQALQQHLGGEELGAGRSQLDGERQAVEAHHQLGQRPRVLDGEAKARIDHLGPLSVYRVHVFTHLS
jgi:hypothetical protein